MMRLISCARNAPDCNATARKVFPVPAGPTPQRNWYWKTIASRYFSGPGAWPDRPALCRDAHHVVRQKLPPYVLPFVDKADHIADGLFGENFALY
jgi:hypothetical protein